jgi:hypothetical protein
MESVDDLAVTWTLHGPELARRVLAQADRWELLGVDRRPWEVLRDLVDCRHNPLADSLPELGDPPTQHQPLRPAVPRAPEPGS